jgi:hypothetical protein
MGDFVEQKNNLYFFLFKRNYAALFKNGSSNVETHNLLDTECFIDLGKLNLLKISLPWSKSVKQTVDFFVYFFVVLRTTTTTSSLNMNHV